jgi:NDP-mannose synthase
MKAVILAGGLGTRLRPFTDIIPKPLLPIGNKSILEIQMANLKKHGFNEIFLATNYKSEYIERFFGNGGDFGVKLHISKETQPLGTAGPVKLLKNELTEPFLVMNGDLLTSANFGELFAFALQQESLLTISVKKEIIPFAFGNVFFDGDFVTGIHEKPDIEMFILAGIHVMKPGIMDFIPDNEPFGMDLLIKKLVDSNKPVTKYLLDDYWLDIGRIGDYEKAQEQF